MRIGMPLSYSGGFKEAVDELRDYERAGLDIVFAPEAYSFDAMTAAGLDHVSDGRFTLSLGASGPQVIEGFHGQPYTAPLARTREIVEICRSVWRREKVVHAGRRHGTPRPQQNLRDSSKTFSFPACGKRCGVPGGPRSTSFWPPRWHSECGSSSPSC
ncbi:LLM class flavin-dependent oxidoreductase [Streptomyces sp. NPDC004237]|uniref:LLM class flavin-dependent oxidoreductase n=1 Tax=Streptomyces sp. NPDC004237 TaxID=3154455 RepID=UPI0033AA41B5